MATVFDIVSTDKNLSKMARGLIAANMEQAISGIGPFTVLAPVNFAFEKLSAPDVFENLLKQQTKSDRLPDILSNHVLTGKKMMRDFRNGEKLQTISGRDVTVTVIQGEVWINGSKILSKDRQGSNGVVHSIDTVNLPSVQ